MHGLPNPKTAQNNARYNNNNNNNNWTVSYGRHVDFLVCTTGCMRVVVLFAILHAFTLDKLRLAIVGYIVVAVAAVIMQIC